jgi:alkylation response protein AidB-like acyl-CoA dehydrogenase
MRYQLEPVTEAGRRFVEQAEKHAAEFATRADENDRDGRFPVENVEAMKASGFTAAMVPAELGGWGVTSLHDLVCAINRLGRADGSSAIGINMHMASAIIGSRLYRGAVEAGDDERAGVLGFFLQMLAGGVIAMAHATEPGTDLSHPLTEVRIEGDTAVINGRKIFGTLSPAADLMVVTCRLKEGEGYVGANAIVPKGTAGQELADDWDALGMRASGSGSAVYRDCRVPAASVVLGETWGVPTIGGLLVSTAGNIGLLGAFLGIAEQARELAVEAARMRTKGPDKRPLAESRGVQDLVAEMDVDLTLCRAALERTARLLDDALARPVADLGIGELHDLNGEFQATKLVVNRKAIEVVDRAMTALGGASYMTGSPLSRLYRDVRAGPFMQPFSPVEVKEYLGKLGLGLDPVVEG